MRVLWSAAFVVALVAGGASAQSAKTPAKQLFGKVTTPTAETAAQVYGGYARGCVTGALQLAMNGPGWQAMRPSRNRRFGHPTLIAYVERLGAAARDHGWPGLLVGDLAQPIGGPMLGGHVSHQTGIDADVWFRPAPEKNLTDGEREKMSAPSYVAKDRKRVTKGWSRAHHAILRSAAEDPATARIFVNAAIKKQMCDDAAAAGEPMDWLRKIRPWYGHRDHFHVRLNCPAGSPDCVAQDPPPPGDGCDQIAWWLSDEVLHPKPNPDWKPKPPLTFGDMPNACRALLKAARK